MLTIHKGKSTSQRLHENRGACVLLRIQWQLCWLVNYGSMFDYVHTICIAMSSLFVHLSGKYFVSKSR